MHSLVSPSAPETDARTARRPSPDAALARDDLCERRSRRPARRSERARERARVLGAIARVVASPVFDAASKIGRVACRARCLFSRDSRVAGARPSNRARPSRCLDADPLFSPPPVSICTALQRGVRHRALPRVRAPALPLGHARPGWRDLRRAVHRHLLGGRRQGAQRAALVPRLQHQRAPEDPRAHRGARHGLRGGEALRRYVPERIFRNRAEGPPFALFVFFPLRVTSVGPPLARPISCERGRSVSCFVLTISTPRKKNRHRARLGEALVPRRLLRPPQVRGHHLRRGSLQAEDRRAQARPPRDGRHARHRRAGDQERRGRARGAPLRRQLNRETYYFGISAC